MNTQRNGEQSFRSFAEFYPFYLSEHSNRISRRWHFVGSALVLIILVAALFARHWPLLWLIPVVGYGCAWIGHFFFEKNRPATFRYPLYSLIGDWRLFLDVLRGKVKL